MISVESHIKFDSFREQVNSISTEEILKLAAEKFDGEIVFASSFGAEDMVIIDMISKLGLNIQIITLDTGRLPEETYKLMDEVRQKYNIKIKAYFPDKAEVENLEYEKGFHSFKDSVAAREECCFIRKIKPLETALKNKAAWVTGLRKTQAVTREGMNKVEIDNSFRNIIKINPLLDWSLDDVWNYIRENKVPYNTLHDKNYPSIGCECCTRAVEDSKDIRAGRWWWEHPETKECGLHLDKLR